MSGTARCGVWRSAAFVLIAAAALALTGPASQAAPPGVDNDGGPTGATTNSCTLRGTLTNGVPASAWICWDDHDAGTGSTGDWAHVVTVGSVTQGVTFAASVTGGLQNVTCWYRCYVSNGDGTDWSDAPTSFRFPAGAPGYKMRIGFSNYNRSEPLTNFPVLVVFSNNMAGTGFNYGTFLSTNGYDLRFWSADETTNLNYEIESWNANSNSFVWVQITNFTNNCTIWATWGNESLTNRQVCTTNGATWESGYKAVWHMDEANFMAQDSTTNRHHATGVVNIGNLSVTNGQIATAASYASAGTSKPYIQVPASPDFDMTNNFTVSGWAWLRGGAYDYSSMIGTYKDTGFGWIVARRGASGTIQFYDNLSGTTWHDSAQVWPTAAWSHVVFAKNGTNASFYLNGVYKSTVVVMANKSSAYDLLIGAGGLSRVGNNCWEGGLDELSISAVTRSSNWIWASYMNTASNALFNTPGAASLAAPVQNSGATNERGTSADFSATVNATSTVYQVWAYWGTVNGTNNAAGLWQNTNSLGWFTNQAVTVTNHAAGLQGGNLYYWTFRVSNEYTNYWADPSLTFATPSQPGVDNDGGATGETADSCTLRGTLTNGAVANAWICWGLSDGGTSSTGSWEHVVSVGQATQGITFATSVTGGLRNVTYCYRCYATNAAGEDWSDSPTSFRFTAFGPSYKMRIAFTNYNRTEPLTNFPALVVFSNGMAGSGFDYGTFLSPSGHDLRFWSADETTNLNYEIESWNTNGSSFVWVQVTNFTNNCTLWATWGNPTQSNRAACTTNGATWLAGYKGVWHLGDAVTDELTSGTYADSSSNNNYGLQFYTATATGIVGRCGNFDGNDYIRTDGATESRFDFQDLVTAEVWVKGSNGWANNWCAFIGKSADNFWSLRRYSNTEQLTWHLNNDNDSGPALSPSLVDGNWHQVVGVYRQSPVEHKMYVDGVLYYSDASPAATLTGNNEPVQISGRQAIEFFRGLMDEARVSQAYRSSNWVWASYMTVASNAVFTAPGTVSSVLPVQNVGATNVGTTVADFSAAVNASSTVYEVWAYWGTVDGTNNAAGLWQNTNSLGLFTNQVIAVTNHATGLPGGTPHYWTFRAANAYTNFWASPSLTFTTLSPPGVDNDGGPTGETTNSCTLRGTLTNGSVATAWVCWDDHDAGILSTGDWAHVESAGAVLQGSTFSVSASGGLRNVTYTYRCYVTNECGVAWSGSATNFHFPNGPEISNAVQNIGSTNVFSSAADFSATVNASSTLYQVWAYWGTVDGTNNATGQWQNTNSLGWFTNQAATVTNHAAGLQEGTWYYWRFQVSNAYTNAWASPSLSFRTTTSGTTWSGTVDSQWSVAGNWSGSSVPGTNDTAIFDSAGTGHTNIDLGGGATVRSLAFDTASAAAYTLGTGAAGSQTLTLNNGGGITMYSGVASTQTVNAAIALGMDAAADTNTFVQSSTARPLVLAGAIAGGTGGSAGAKTLIVTNAGTVTVNGVIGNGGASSLQLTKTGAGLLSLTVANTFTGGALLAGGTNVIAGGESTLGAYPATFQSNSITLLNGARLGKFTLGDTGFTISANRGIYLGPGQQSIGKDFSGNQYVIVNSVISGPGGLNAYSGYHFELNADNTYSGDTEYFSNGMTDGTRGLFVNRALALQNSTLNCAAVWKLYFSYGSNPGAVFTLGGLKGNQPLTLPVNGTAGGLTIGNNNQSTTYSGVLSGGGTNGITKIGTGMLTLSGANTYAGRTTISNGTLSVASPGSLPSATALYINGSGQMSNSTSVTVARLFFDGAQQAAGTWGAAGSAAANQSSRFLGTNIVTVTGDDFITNNAALNVGTQSADLAATLNAPSATLNVSVYWGTVDGTNNAAGLWQYTNSLGWFTNQVCGLTNPVSGLQDGVWYYYTFRVQNGPTNSWASPSASFKTTAAGATWNGAVDGQWSVASNWTGTIPGSGNRAMFNSDGNGNRTLDLGTGVTIQTLYFDLAACGAYTIGLGAAGSQTLMFNNDGDVTMGSAVTTSQTVNAAIVLGTNAAAGGNTIRQLSTAGTLTLAGGVAGGSGGTAGAKTMTVTNDGPLIISSAIGDGGTTAVGLNKTGGGTLTLTGANTYSGPTTNSAGTIKLGAAEVIPGAVTVNGTLDLAGFNETVSSLSGTGLVNNSTGSGTNTLTITNAANCAFGGVITNTAGAIQVVKTGAGMLTLSGANKFSGGLVVNGGTLYMASGENALGAYPGAFRADAITLNNGARLGTFTGGDVAFSISANRGIFLGSGQQAMGKDSSGNAFITINSVISGPGGMDYYLGYYCDLMADNTYSGDTRIYTCVDSGRGVRLNKALNLQNSTLDYNSYGGYVQYTYGSNPGAVFTLGGLKGNQNLALPVNGTSGGLIIGNNSQDTSYSGSMSGGGTNGIAKIGTGTLTLNGANTYTGKTLISAGTLALSGSGSIANSTNITVASGAAFDVSGRSAALALGAGQALKTGAAGTNATATLRMASAKGLTLSAAGLAFTNYCGGATAPFTVDGADSLSLNGAPVTVTTTTPLQGGNYTLIAKSGSATVSGMPGALTVNGSGTLMPGVSTSLSVVSGELILTVGQAATSISDVTPSQTNTVGSVLLLAGTVSAAGPAYPTNGAPVLVTLSNSTYSTSASNTYVSGDAGRFTNLFSTAGIPGSAEAYTVTYVYAGDSNFGGATNNSTAVSLPPLLSPGTLFKFR